MQWNVAALENRAGADGEIFLALIATVETVLARGNALSKAANRTTRPLWPKPTFNVNARRLLVREFLEQFEG